MKFADKIIWSCLITLAVLFSIGSTLMIYTNHEQLLRSTIQTRLYDHDIEINALTSKVFRDTLEDTTEFGQDAQLVQERIIYYLQQFQSASADHQKSYALMDEEGTYVYTDIPKDVEDEAASLSDQQYALKQIGNQEVMIVKSSLSAGKDQYSLISVDDMSFLFQERSRQLNNFVVISLILYVIAYFILRLISRHLTKSIHRLNEVSKRISQGNYQERTCIVSNDEIGELSKSFDEMAEINERTICQLQDNVERREEFMAGFSHEIKTPMTVIIGFADILRTGVYDEETRKKAAQYIYTEGKRLEKLSFTLMDLLKLSHQAVELQPVCLSSIIRQLQNYYDAQHVLDQLHFHIDACCVRSQPELLFVLLRNLIDNALKASMAGQPIEIRASRAHAHVCLQVIDQGIGMDEESVKKASEPFYMADQSRSRSMGGAGLGLTIVKKICELHHTALQVESTPHQGTKVSLTLEVDQDE